MKAKALILLFVITTALLSSVTYAHDDECEIVTGNSRVYYGVCPKGEVVVGSRTDHVGQFTYTYVACVKLELKCGQKLEDYKHELVIQQSISGTRRD